MLIQQHMKRSISILTINPLHANGGAREATIHSMGISRDEVHMT